MHSSIVLGIEAGQKRIVATLTSFFFFIKLTNLQGGSKHLTGFNEEEMFSHENQAATKMEYAMIH